MYQFVLRTTVLAALVFASSAFAMDLKFTGRSPDLPENSKVQMTSGAVPGIPILFDISHPPKVIVRPARNDEKSNESRALYRFELQADKSMMFYELYDQKLLEKLSQRNAKDIESEDGKSYELKVVSSFFSEGKVLKNCLSSDFMGVVTAYIVVGESGNQEQVVILPEGSVAQCMMNETKSRVYSSPPSPFVAKASIRVNK